MDTIAGGSLAYRAREAILESILQRRFEDSRLPPENELAEMLGVSRTTVRSALQSLEQHGVLTRSPRRGTLVPESMSPSMVALHRLIGFKRLLEDSGYEVDVVSTSVCTTEAAPEVYDQLGVAKGTAVYQVDRVFKANGQAAIWVINYLPADAFLRPPTEDELAQSPFDMRTLLVRGPVDHATVELVPQKATGEVVTRLGLKRSEAYLLVKEVHIAESGEIVAFSHIHVNDHFVRFRLHRGGPGR